MDTPTERLSTGITGLDEILNGGLLKGSACLVRGGPGLGKTTLGLHFLTGAGPEESTLFIGFQEHETQLRANATSVGLDVSDIRFLSLAPDEHFFTEQQGYDVFAAADVEPQPLAEAVVQTVEQSPPSRVFVDSLTQLRYLSADIFQYRKQVLSFLRYLRERGATVLFSSESSRDLPDDDLQFISDGIINLEPGPLGSALRVSKLRGTGFRQGAHQYRVNERGMAVFPRPLPPRLQQSDIERRQWRSGVARLDEILHGGLEAGTVSLVTGPSGIGKSTLASLFLAQAGAQQRRAAVYLFEEEMDTFLRRARALGVDLDTATRDGHVHIEQVEPMRYLVDEFAMQVRDQVEEGEVDLVVLDSTSGFELAVSGEDIRTRLHAIAKGLARRGASVLLINEVEAMTGQSGVTEKGISYLSDNVIFMRYLEVEGRMSKALGVLKKRLSEFDNRLYTFDIGPGGICIDGAVRDLGGVPMAARTQQMPN